MSGAQNRFDLAFVEWLEGIYKDLHRHPELGMDVPWTTKYVRDRAAELGLEAEKNGLDVGAVFVIKGTQPGPTLALRADMDALPIEEAAPVAWKSEIPGRMHACGHDLNTTVMLGVLRCVMEQKLAEKMRGNLKFIFQPGEETLEGAKALIAAGALENPSVDVILVSHGDADLHVGEVGVFREFSHANSDEFRIKLCGKGGHGARPHQTQDVIVAGSRIVEAFQTIVSRELDAREATVISVCEFHAGTAMNIIPAVAKLTGTVRTLKKEVQAHVMKRMKDTVDALAALHGVEAKFEFLVGCPSCPIDNAAENLIREAAGKTLGAENVKELKTRMGGEDFAFYAQFRPAGTMRLGITPQGETHRPSTHSPLFRPDLEALQAGTAVFVQLVKDYLL
ncbi:MAG: M20 family metallopeptidase [Pyramidobacter sp.]|uniref:M20 metallopeptidase family protein n=1 Tax=Pyramidobacter sp. TaxID=1943581 RepID=UPI002A829290|nr:M20 family metallopeptidase [Pyramidobacter sp.]MDY4031791.1 M20 family metallopeptidase [Pyramidobacter sp.]